jgi:hypothetical protein
MQRKEKILGIFLVLIFLSFIVIDQTITYFKDKLFFESALNTTIVKIKNNWSGGRSYDYITKNNVIIILEYSDSLNLKIGDSVVKKSNTRIFYVYRKGEDSDYKFYRVYETNVNPSITPQH